MHIKELLLWHRQPGLASICALRRLDGPQCDCLLLLQCPWRRRAAASGPPHAGLWVSSPLCADAWFEHSQSQANPSTHPERQ